jgi:adenine phosphoribosyltransferase
MRMDATALTAFIRDVPDFPQPGIVFKDITPLLANADAFAGCIDRLADGIRFHGVSGIVAIESRGFILGGALAHHLQLPLLIVRKPGKLPAKTRSIAYALEYGSGILEIHEDAVVAGHRYVIVDDVLATGGTARAAGDLIELLGGAVAGYSFLIELAALGGRARLGSSAIDIVMQY